eukprot:m.60424 g.60424  ORF g.60424 m.60424 type:complete len:86 (+) comp12293_c0_seq1:62-319(+)
MSNTLSCLPFVLLTDSDQKIVLAPTSEEIELAKQRVAGKVLRLTVLRDDGLAVGVWVEIVCFTFSLPRICRLTNTGFCFVKQQQA